MDQYPYREDGVRALSESVETIKAFEKAIDRFGEENISRLIAEGDATRITAALRKMLFS